MVCRLNIVSSSGVPVGAVAAEPCGKPFPLGGDQLVGHAPGLIEREPGLDDGVGEHRVVDEVPVLVERGAAR